MIILFLFSGITVGYLKFYQKNLTRLFQVGKGSLISIRLGCNQESSDFLTAYLQRDDNKEVVVSE